MTVIMKYPVMHGHPAIITAAVIESHRQLVASNSEGTVYRDMKVITEKDEEPCILSSVTA